MNGWQGLQKDLLERAIQIKTLASAKTISGRGETEPNICLWRIGAPPTELPLTGWRETDGTRTRDPPLQ